METMESKDFDLVKAGAAVQKISDLQTAHRLEMLKAMKEARSVLTEDQFKQMKKTMHAMADGKMSGHMSKKHK
jgi:Spy/CpxP family protein refolding chaperone